VYDYNDGKWYPDPSFILHVSGGSTFETAMAFSGEGKTVAMASTVINSENVNGIEEDYAEVTIVHNYKIYTLTLSSTIHHGDYYLSLSYDGDRIAYSCDEKVIVREYYSKPYIVQTWEQVGLTIESDDANEEDFGSAVVLSPDGNFVAVTSKSSTRVYSSPPHNMGDQGSTDTTPWEQVGNTIYSENDSTHPTAVSLLSHEQTLGDGSGTVDLLTLTISDSGSVRVFHFNTRDSTTWTLKGGESAMLRHTGEWPTGFGSSLSVSDDGETVAVGAPLTTEDEDNFQDGGKVLLFDLQPVSS